MIAEPEQSGLIHRVRRNLHRSRLRQSPAPDYLRQPDPHRPEFLKPQVVSPTSRGERIEAVRRDFAGFVLRLLQ